MKVYTLFQTFVNSWKHLYSTSVQGVSNGNGNEREVAPARSLEKSKLVQQKQINHLIIESALDAVIAIDITGHILEWNTQATNIFGWKREEVIGKDLGDLIVPFIHREAHKSGMKRLLATGQSQLLNKRIEISGLHNHGHEFPIELSIVQFEEDGITTFSAFIRDLTEIKKKEEEIKQKEMYIQAANKSLYDLKLYALRSKLNPHFYFNTLNNLYSLALLNSPDTPGVILKLSSVMEYIIYECDTDKVFLEKELQFLDDYVAIQRLRYSRETSIEFLRTGEAQGLTIVPLILIQFVENAFKHGLQQMGVNGWLQVNAMINKGKLEFRVSNNKTEGDSREGVGLLNARNRLELLYPKTHTLRLDIKEDSFHVQLNLTL